MFCCGRGGERQPGGGPRLKVTRMFWGDGFVVVNMSVSCGRGGRAEGREERGGCRGGQHPAEATIVFDRSVSRILDQRVHRRTRISVNQETTKNILGLADFVTI